MDSCGFVEQGRSWIDSSKFCSYGDLYAWGRKSVRKSLLLLIIPKSIAGRHSLSVLANSETTQPLDHFSPLLLGVCVLRGPWPLHNERMSKRLPGKMWFFSPLSILFLAFFNETWFSIPWWFDPSMKPQDGLGSFCSREIPTLSWNTTNCGHIKFHLI